MLESLAIFGPDGYSALDRLAIGVQWGLFDAVLVEFNVDRGPIVEVLKNDVDVDGS